MLLPGTEQKEILERTQNRVVFARINMMAPVDMTALVTINANKQNLKPDFDVVLDGNRAHIHAGHFWEAEDKCTSLAEKDPTVLNDAVQAIRARRKKVNSGELTHGDVIRAAFDSEDVIVRAVGIEPKLSYKFGEEVKKGRAPDFSAVPFKKLREYFGILQSKLEEIDGYIDTVHVAHSSSMSAFDYYEQDFKKSVGIGRRFSYGDVMLAKAHNLLVAVGTPLVIPPKKNMN